MAGGFLDDLERIALRELGIFPWEFDALEPWQFRQLLAGHRARQRDRWTIAAQQSAWQLAPYSKRRLQAKHLISFPPDPLDADDAAPPRPARRRRKVLDPRG
jgi:hypothetical protein